MNGKAKTKKLPKTVSDWMTKDLNYQGTQWLTEPQYKAWLRTATKDQEKAQISFFYICLQSGSPKDCMKKSQSIKMEEEDDDGHLFLSDDSANTLTMLGGVATLAGILCLGATAPAAPVLGLVAVLIGGVLAIDACGANLTSMDCGNALLSVATGFIPMWKSGEAMQGVTTIGSKASQAGRAVRDGARSAWRSVSDLFGG